MSLGLPDESASDLPRLARAKPITVQKRFSKKIA